MAEEKRLHCGGFECMAACASLGTATCAGLGDIHGCWDCCLRLPDARRLMYVGDACLVRCETGVLSVQPGTGSQTFTYVAQKI